MKRDGGRGIVFSVDELFGRLAALAERLGIDACLPLEPRLLWPEERIRRLCSADSCENYGRHYMCPPHAGPLDEIEARLRGYSRGALLRYCRPVDVPGDHDGVARIKSDFQQAILRLEDLLRDAGCPDVWGLMGGSCGLCTPCRAASNEPCPYPDRARMSLESIAVDVLALLGKFNLDGGFHRDRITWTGCVLF